MKRRLFSPNIDRKTKTWDVKRVLVALLAVVFSALALWLGLHEHMLSSESAPLLCIPAAFAVLLGSVALVASDWCIGQLMSLSTP